MTIHVYSVRMISKRDSSEQKILIMALFMSLSGTVSAARFIAPVDTLGNSLPIDEGERMRQDSLKKTHNNTATGFDATKYILEGRYRNYGDKFTHNWSDRPRNLDQKKTRQMLWHTIHQRNSGEFPEVAAGSEN